MYRGNPVKEKNVSNLTKTLAVMTLLAPVTAQPLGIGDIELHSVLNQKLNAVIKLHLAGENPSDISVRLAPPEKFDQAGVPWSYFLSKIKFDPVVNADGSMLIKVSTKETFVEPFLNFLLEVSWPQGNLVREFTLLLDPPAEYQSPSFPGVENNFERAEPLTETIAKPARQRSSRSTARAVRSANSISPTTSMDGEYRPTQSQDTLWRIAEDIAGSKQGVSTAQMMNALFRANPDAFINGNMDLLKVGAVLKIPETQAVLQDSGAEKTSRTGAVAPVKKPLELVTPTESTVAENAELGGHAKTSVPNAATESGAGNSKDLELQARIQKLEEQLNMMQQLLALKDQQLATLQNKDKGATAIASLPPTTSQPLAVTEQPAVVSPAPEVVKLPVIPATVQPTLKPKPSATQKPVSTTPPLASDEGDSTTYILTVGALGTSMLALLGGLWWRKRKIEQRTNSESMFASASQIKMPDADSALSVPVVDISNATAYDVGTVGESSFISDFTPSDFDAFDTDQSEVDPLSEADVYLAYGRYQQAEDLIRHAIRDVPERDDYKLKLLEILYANESKEAFAVYAQELSDAGKQADRVFWTKVSDMGKEIAPEFALFGGVEPQLDATVQAGSDFSTANNISASAAFATETEVADFDHDDDLIDLNDASLPDLVLMDDINSELAELELNSDSYSQTSDNGLDFDLSSFSESASRNKDQVDSSAGTDTIETIDFDLSSMALDTIESEGKTVDAVEDALENFDFNFDLEPTEAKPLDAVNGEAPLDMAHLESFDFPDFTSGSESELTTAEEAQSLKPAISEALSSSDEFDFNFDFDVPSVQDREKDETELGVFDLTDMDEFETKIDLAKAYIDMGDIEAARNIAKEVLEKGTKEQKQAAQAILAEL
jgi:pilus assembly protein FimV